MLSNKQHNEKVLKIFSAIRCVNKDQLPRYMDGRLTEIEKHLLEQHLVDCDLCYGALQALEKEGEQEQYQDLTGKLQRYVKDSIQPVSHVQKVAQYTKKEKTKEHLLFYFWVFAFIGLGIGSVYVLRGHIRNQPPPSPDSNASENTGPGPATNAAVVAPVNNAQPSTPNPVHLPNDPVASAATAKTPASVDSAAIKKALALKAAQRKATADSLAKVKRAQLLQKQQDSIRREAEKAKEKEAEKPKDKEKNDEQPKQAPKQETAAVKEKENNPEPAKKEAAQPTAVDSDEYLYKAAMVFQQQGNYNEAIDRYRRLESISSGKYKEMARYQLAVCYRNKGQTGKARRMFKEVIRMDGSMKNAAQQALDGL
jgi:tetratricopeptide (TPR) repeat protein